MTLQYVTNCHSCKCPELSRYSYPGAFAQATPFACNTLPTPTPQFDTSTWGFGGRRVVFLNKALRAIQSLSVTSEPPWFTLGRIYCSFLCVLTALSSCFHYRIYNIAVVDDDSYKSKLLVSMSVDQELPWEALGAKSNGFIFSSPGPSTWKLLSKCVSDEKGKHFCTHSLACWAHNERTSLNSISAGYVGTGWACRTRSNFYYRIWLSSEDKIEECYFNT